MTLERRKLKLIQMQMNFDCNYNFFNFFPVFRSKMNVVLTSMCRINSERKTISIPLFAITAVSCWQDFSNKDLNVKVSHWKFSIFIQENLIIKL